MVWFCVIHATDAQPERLPHTPKIAAPDPSSHGGFVTREVANASDRRKEAAQKPPL
jgi:hypothetical protein